MNKRKLGLPTKSRCSEAMELLRRRPLEEAGDAWEVAEVRVQEWEETCGEGVQEGVTCCGDGEEVVTCGSVREEVVTSGIGEEVVTPCDIELASALGGGEKELEDGGEDDDCCQEEHSEEPAPLRLGRSGKEQELELDGGGGDGDGCGGEEQEPVGLQQSLRLS